MDGYIYFYDQGGPVLNNNLSDEYDHLEAHKDWFRSIHKCEWNSQGNYAYRNTEAPSLSEISTD